MRERPIIFNAQMVRAILDGSKTQTRRVIKPQPFEWEDQLCYVPRRMTGHYNILNQPDINESSQYGAPGDRLWVREPWSKDATTMYPCPEIWYRASDDIYSCSPHTCPGDNPGNYADCLACWEHENGNFKWRPSIHMPRKFSRIDLDVFDLGVQRIQDISESDAQAEGVTMDDDPYWRPTSGDPDSGGRPSHINTFNWLWDSINADRGFAWDKNPWVWVVDFMRVK